MGIKDFFGVGSAKSIGEGIGAAATGLDKLFTSKDEKLTHAEIMERIQQQPQSEQIEVNKIEAGHRTIFVAGWRPFCGWVCGSALAYHYIFRDLLAWILTNLPVTVTPPPDLDISQLMTILAGLLGLAGLRTSEKKAGVSA